MNSKKYVAAMRRIMHKVGYKKHQIVGIGVDCEDIDRFKKMSLQFIRKMFTKKEVRYCESRPKPSQHYAARFAAKEAIIKALSNKNSKVFFNEIEIINDKTGVPKVRFINNKMDTNLNVYLSLAHSQSIAVGFVIITQNR